MTQKNPGDRFSHSFFDQVKDSCGTGLKKGWSGLVWLLKILVPISFLTALMVHFRLFYHIDFLLEPLMSLIHLPAQAAVVLVIGLCTGIYGTVAALSVMPFSMDHMILIAVFTLISHNIVQESLVQASSGLNFFIAAGFRLVVSFVVTGLIGLVLGIEPGGAAAAVAAGAQGAVQGTLNAMLADWLMGTVHLCIQIFCIIMPLMVLMELAKTFRVIQGVTRMISPVMSMLGLDRSTAVLWMTAAVFGLAYGSAVIVEEARANKFDKQALTRLHLSIGVNHAMIEDPCLLLPLGIPVFWLWIPRLAAAIAVAWLYSGYVVLWRVYAQRFGHKKFCNH